MENAGNNQLVIEIIKIACTVIVPFIAYFLGRSTRFDAKREAATMKRMQDYYWPLMERYMTGFWWEISYSYSDMESKGLFFELIVNNSYLADKQTQELVPDFYQAYLDVLEHKDGNQDYDFSCLTKLDVAFSQVIDSVYKEYVSLCKQLGYPEPAALAPPLVYDGCEDRE